MTRRFDDDRLVMATHNEGKRAEMAALLKPYGLTLTSNHDHGLGEPMEDGASFAANARIKALAAMEATGLPALADDSGIEIAALDGRPGIHTADWAETGSGRDFGVAMDRAHREILETRAAPPWRARFVTVLVLVWPDGEAVDFRGEVSGQLVWPPRGDRGHGYDPMFQPDGYDVTFGEMDRWTKNEMSHRGRAVSAMVAACFG